MTPSPLQGGPVPQGTCYKRYLNCFKLLRLSSGLFLAITYPPDPLNI